MNWIMTEMHNLPVTLCGVFYSVLCIFSIVTGLMYAGGKKKLNPLELSDKFVAKLSDDDKMKQFAIKMGWVTFVVGIVQGLTALAIFKGYNTFLNLFAIGFTIFSITSVSVKLKGKISAFAITKFIFYVIILGILLLNGVYNYGATPKAVSYLQSDEKVTVTKVKEGYFFDGPGSDTAIIFFPGARIQYTAYAGLMHKIAENGRDCFLLAEPFNIAFFSKNKPSKIIKQYSYQKWYLAGHSLGGVIACDYISNHPSNITGMIAFASYPAKELPETIQYISIYGSEDQVLDIERYETFKMYLPKGYQQFVINGGNHAGFGDYGVQKGDGTAKLTSEEQQEFVVQNILKYEI